MIVEKTNTFNEWLENLTNDVTQTIIFNHIKRMENDNLGNVKPVGSGVYEKKINVGAGYRIYFCRINNQLILLLYGGDKSSQQADIQTAIKMKGLVKWKS